MLALPCDSSSMLFDIQVGQAPVFGVSPGSSAFVKRSAWLMSARLATSTQNAQVPVATVVANQYATRVPAGETFALIAPVPGAGMLIGAFSSPPLWVMR